jgi:hypothetical protein
MKVKSLDKSERHFIALLEGSQASFTWPSDKGSLKVKTLKRLKILTPEKGHRILIFGINVRF